MWNTLIIEPFINVLLFIYSLLGQNFGLAIIVFTIIVRLATYPLTASQMKSSAALTELQGSKKWQDIQAKYKDDREKLAQEQMKLYQEMGINPFGSCLPTLIQFPLIIGLYQAVISALAATPLQLLSLTQTIYRFPADSFVYNIFPPPSEIIPLNSHFLWMDLGQPERLIIPGIPFGIPVLAILVFITSFLQTKLMTPPSTGGNDQAAAMSKMMGIYMPVLIAWLSYTYAGGLALYFVASNVVGIAQYAALGKLDWRNLLSGGKQAPAQTKPAPPGKSKPARAAANGKPGSKKSKSK